MKLSGIILAILMAVSLPVFVSCEKMSGENESGVATLQLNVGIEDSAQLEETKGVMYGSPNFTSGQTFGLCIVKHGTATPVQSGYGNIKVTCKNNSGNNWEFYNSVTGQTITSLELPVSGGNVDIYAYAPYVSGVSSPFQVPFNFMSNTDYLVAQQNLSVNRNITPTAGATIPVTLTFGHRLSRLHIGINLENYGSNHIVDYIAIKRAKSGTSQLCSDASMDLRSNNSTSSTNVDSIGVSFGTNLDGLTALYENETYFDIFLYQAALAADGDYVLVFCIDGFLHEYPIKRTDVSHDGKGAIFGFVANYTYNFHFTFDNYVHLKGITIQSGWASGGTFNYDLNLH